MLLKRVSGWILHSFSNLAFSNFCWIVHICEHHVENAWHTQNDYAGDLANIYHSFTLTTDALSTWLYQMFKFCQITNNVSYHKNCTVILVMFLFCSTPWDSHKLKQCSLKGLLLTQVKIYNSKRIETLSEILSCNSGASPTYLYFFLDSYYCTMFVAVLMVTLAVAVVCRIHFL